MPVTTMARYKRKRFDSAAKFGSRMMGYNSPSTPRPSRIRFGNATRPAAPFRVSPRIINKLGQSRTKTALKRKQKFTNPATPDGFGGCRSRFVLKFKNVKGRFFMQKQYNAASRYVRNIQITGSFTSAQGRQGVVSLMPIYSGTDLVTLLNNTAYHVAADKQSAQVYHSNCFANIMFTNAKQTTAELLLFDCLARRDGNETTEGPAETWAAGTTTPYQGDGGAVISGGAGDAGYWGTRPTVSKLFNGMWKIKRRTKCILAPGQSLKHQVTIHPGRMSNSAVVSTTEIQGGWTYFLMVIVAGNQVIAQDGTPTNISLADTKIDYVYNKCYKYGVVSGTSTQFQTTAAFPSAAWTEKVINMESGTIINPLEY